MISICFPGCRMASLNVREHWRARHRRVQRERGLARVKVSAAAVPALPVVVTLVRIAPRALDYDNLVGAGKGWVDGVADALGIDDRDPRVTWRYEQRKGKSREVAVEIRIEAAP